MLKFTRSNWVLTFSIVFLIVVSARYVYVHLRGPLLPAVVCDEAVFNWGSAPAGSVVTHSFLLRNQGNRPLVILRVRPDCGCTASNAPVGPVPPGKTRELVVRYPVGTTVGEAQTRVLVYTNDPNSPVLTLEIRGNVSQAALTSQAGWKNLGQGKQ